MKIKCYFRFETRDAVADLGQDSNRQNMGWPGLIEKNELTFPVEITIYLSLTLVDFETD